LNLYDFSFDSKVKALADKELILALSVLRISSFHGQIVPPLTRKNFDQRNATDDSGGYAPSISQQLLWFYFGEPKGFGYYEFINKYEPLYAAILATSSWRPIEALYKSVQALDGGYRLQTITPGFSIWGEQTLPFLFGDAYISDDYALATGNGRFEPQGYSEHYQTFSALLKSDKIHNAFECYHPYFNAKMGDKAWGTDRWSPFLQTTLINESTVALIWDIPSKDPWPPNPESTNAMKRSTDGNILIQKVVCRIPKDIPHIILDKAWLILKEGGIGLVFHPLIGEIKIESENQTHILLNLEEKNGAGIAKILKTSPDESMQALQKRAQSSSKIHYTTNSIEYIAAKKPNLIINYSQPIYTEKNTILSTPKLYPPSSAKSMPINSPAVILHNGNLEFTNGRTIVAH
jgi:hypothetical protein